MNKILFVLVVCSLALTGCKKKGCTNPAALNYDSKAKQEDGSCEFPPIGASYQGGIIFYQDGNGGGLISAPTDQSSDAEWGTAADICANLTLSGYSDWYLPSKDELNLMWTNSANSAGDTLSSGPSDPNNIGVFARKFYWSSTENGSYAWAQKFSYGNDILYPKDYTFYVRAIRAF